MQQASPQAEAVAGLLAEIPLFEALRPEERATLARKVHPRHFAEDEVVFHRDDLASHLYVVSTGVRGQVADLVFLDLEGRVAQVSP